MVTAGATFTSASGSVVGRWSPTPPPLPDALVVVAPHPDDEVLGAAMTMRWAHENGCRVSVIACTDGEASHGRSTAVTSRELRRRRAGERAEALGVLGLDPAVRRLGFPDGGVADHVADLAEELAVRCGPGTAILVPWANDGHPDHEAVAEAGALAAERTQACLWQAPIWGKVRCPQRFDPRRFDPGGLDPGGESSGTRTSHLYLTDHARSIKATAASAFVTQIAPVGDGAFDGPVVDADELAAMLDGAETIIW